MTKHECERCSETSNTKFRCHFHDTKMIGEWYQCDACSGLFSKAMLGDWTPTIRLEKRLAKLLRIFPRRANR